MTMSVLLNAPQQASSLLRSEDVEQNFQDLALCWRRETALQSSVTAIAMHPAYQQIIGMGDRALPLIFRELRREPDHWFWALGAITGENPVPDAHAGDLDAMTHDWLFWGEAHGHTR